MRKLQAVFSSEGRGRPPFRTRKEDVTFLGVPLYPFTMSSFQPSTQALWLLLAQDWD